MTFTHPPWFSIACTSPATLFIAWRLGGLSRPVVMTGVGSAALLAGIVQTPGLSHFFGCRPLGPLGWVTAIGASAAATGAAAGAPRLAEKVLARLRLGEAVMADPEALAASSAGRLPET